MHVPQHLFYIIRHAFRPYSTDSRLMPYALPRGTVLVASKGMSFAEDDYCAPDVPDIAMTLDGERFGISWSMRANKVIWADVVIGPFSEDHYQKGIWYVQNNGASYLHALIRRAGSGVVLSNESGEIAPLLCEYLSFASGDNSTEHRTCFRPVYGEETDGPYRVQKFEQVPTIELS